MPREFKSIYSASINELINVNRSMKIKFESAESYLHKLDDFAAATGQTSQGITRQFAEMWCEKREEESLNTRYRRVVYMTKLSNFLIDSGIESYIPELPRKPISSFVPYIFSAEEISRLFAASDQLRLKILDKDSAIFSVPALVRVLYGAGLRFGEAKNLTDEDVNLEQRWLHIKISKNGRERTIPISNSLCEVLKQYLVHRNLLSLTEKPETFFVRLDGKKVSYRVWNYFIESLGIAGIQHVPCPRLRDLRHTFAVNAVKNMIDRGLDVNVLLPVLSNYLGHDSFESTLHYVRVTSQLFPRMFIEMRQECDVYPKKLEYENA